MAIKKKVVEVDTQQAQQQVDQLKESMAGLNQENKAATTSVKDLRQELKAQKDAMLSAEQGTDEYNAALKRAAEIQHTLKEQMEQVNASAMDFGQIAGNGVKAVAGLTAGLQAAKATMNLFGIENETVLKSLQQMQNLMAITQALPALDNGIKAFKRLGLVIKSATAGMNGFKAALVSTGIGAVVVALGLLIANWDKVTEAMKKWGIIHQTTAEKLEEEKKKAEELRDKLKEAQQAYEDWEKQQKVNNLSSEAKAQYDELTNTIEGAKLKLKEFDAAMAAAGNNRKKWEELREQAREYEAIRDNAERARTAILNNAEATREAAEKNKEAEERRKKAIEQAEKLRKEYEKLVVEIGNYNKTQKELDIDKLNKEEEERIKLIEKAEKNQVIREQRITAVKAYYEAERLKIEKKYAQQAIKDKQEQAFAELKLLEDNYQLQQAALQASLDDQIIDLEQFNERKKELDDAYKEDYISTLQAMLDDETLNVEQRLELYEKLNEFRAPKKEDKDTSTGKTDEKSLSDGITEAINASALALNDFSNNQAWSKILQNVATLTANWDVLHENIKKGGTEAFTAYAQIAATALGAVAQMMNGLAAEQDTSNEKGFESQKNLQAAGATMSMLSGIVSAWASSMQLGPIAGPILGAILSAMMLATGIANIVKIKQQKFGSKSTPSASASPSTAAISSINAPVQYTQDVQGANIEGAIKDTRVYVTESDISNTQKRVNVAESENRY